jgi:hypothetical protein
MDIQKLIAHLDDISRITNQLWLQSPNDRKLKEPLMRTEWKKVHILSMKDVSFEKHFFFVRNIRYWHITSYLGAYGPFIQPGLNAIDKVLSRIPLIRLMA